MERGGRRLRLLAWWVTLLVPIPLFTWLGYLWNDALAGILLSVAFVATLAWAFWHYYGFFPDRDEFVDGPDESEL